jgi:uncharacterized membrane protein
MKSWPLGLWRSLSGTGLLLGILFFAASLTPTLIPRTYVTQGVLGGGVFAIGYGLGVFWRWLWSYMELPTPEERTLRVANLVIALFCAVTAAAFLWRAAEWQNSIRTRWSSSRSRARTRSRYVRWLRRPSWFYWR